MPDRGRRDLRRYASSTQFRLALGAVFLLFLGDLLIWWIYGWDVARSALLCTGFGLFLGLMIVAWFLILSWLARRADRE